jgi:hypothetical protein
MASEHDMLWKWKDASLQQDNGGRVQEGTGVGNVCPVHVAHN